VSRPISLVLFLVVLAMPRAAAGQEAAPSHFKVAASARLRYELWNWFDPAGVGGNSYGYFGAQAHANFTYDSRRWFDLRVDLQNTSLLGLPEESNAAAPLGDLGAGATYYAVHGEGNLSRFFLNQGYVTFKSPGHAATYLRAGRFEYTDGLETITGDPALDWLKRTRISSRLIGTFGFSHGGRSFDGVSGALDHAKVNLTALAVHPRQGGFESEGMPDIGNVDLAALTMTLKPGTLFPRGEVRLFVAYYGDERSPRDTVIKSDNRPAPIRAADSAAISMPMIGAHLIKAFALGSGTGDALLWGVVQGGDWGQLDHRAYAIAAELGFQPRMAGNPWVRTGYYRGSGDDDPANGTHGTFVPVLTTVRQYAQFPFYNAMNLEDLFVQLHLRPIPGKLAIRTDLHRLWLTEPADLWYGGSGAGQQTRSFGFGGRPSGGSRDLATLADLALTWDPTPRASVYLYFGHAFGGQVIDAIYGDSGADFGYGEFTVRF
jgi:hypothetical protein